MSDCESTLERIKAVIEKWDKDHSDPNHSWHLQECCVDEMIEELKKAMAGPSD